MSHDPGYPADIRSYDHVPGSPFYEDPSEGLDEMTREELTSLLSSLQSTYEDPDCPRRARHAAESRSGAAREALDALVEPEGLDDAASALMTFPDRPLSNMELFYMRMCSRSIMDDPSTPEDLRRAAGDVFEKATAALIERGRNPEQKP